MKEYIDKAAVKTELERRIKVSQDYAKCNLTEKTRIGNHAQQLELNDILAFIDTLEVKEVDLEKEVNQYFEKTWPFEEDDEDIIAFARHFFELGLKAWKGE